MNIIRKGKPPEEKEYEFDCSRCGCVFIIQLKEGEVTYDQRDGDYLSYKCPTCGNNCAHGL